MIPSMNEPARQRHEFIQNAQKRRYAWAKRVDPDAVKNFELESNRKTVKFGTPTEN